MEAAKENATPAKEYDLESDLAKKIKKQVEFYFSDSNFPKDKFLRAESEKHAEGCILTSLSPFTFPFFFFLVFSLNLQTFLSRSYHRSTA